MGQRGNTYHRSGKLTNDALTHAGGRQKMLNCSRLVKLAAVAVVFAHLSLAAFAQDDLHAKIEAAFAKIRPYGLYGNEGASNALLAMAPQMHTARPEFIAALGESHMVVRWSAARVLGTIGPEAREAVPALATALPTSEWYAQVMIAWAIRRMGPAGKEAVPALGEVLGKSKDVWVKREVAATLGEIGPEARAALPQLTAALKDPNGFVRVAAAKSLYQIDRDASGVPLLIEALKNYDIVGPRIAADALAEMGEGARPALPALVTTLKDPAPCAQVAAARALWLIDKSTQGVPMLIAALSDEVTEVRERASATLKLISAATGKTFPEPPAPPAAAKPLVFNAEEWTGPTEAILKNRGAADKWNLWSEGAPAWSRGVILCAPSVPKDRTTSEEGAPVLHTHLTGIPAGTYDVTVQQQRPLGVSLDEGKTWRKVDGASLLGTFTIKDGVFDLWVDDRYAATGSPGPHYYNTITLTPSVVRPAPPPRTPVRGWATQRVRERLSRGLTAIRTADGVYLSWRLLAEDPKDIAFNVYRADGAGKGQLLNTAPITATTDFLDRTAPTGSASRYNVVPAGKVTSKVPSTAVALPGTDLPYLPIKLQGDYKATTVGVGDLDGDGRMDYVVKQPDTQIWGFLYTWYRSPGTYKLEAYNADGKFLWRHSMGWGIELGVWFSTYVVYDLDGDGCAEVAYKGTDADPRDAEGVVNEGREYVVVLDGRTGDEISRAEFPNRDNFGSAGRPGDVAARNQLAIAYLDGKTPCVIAERGTYGLQKVMAYQLKSGKLEILWRWDNADGESKFYGQGAHTLHAADVDGDGRDEVILGSSVLDDTGAPLWSTGRGHPDVCCVGDFVPSNPGLEIFYTLENPQKDNGTCIVYARTGQFLWGHPGQTYHVGSGQVSDVDPAHPGCEAWAAEDPKSGAFGGGPAPRWMYSAAGELLAEGKDVPQATSVLYWDGDIQRELLRGGQPRDLQGATYPPAIQGTVLAIADVTGDWREEIITALPGEIRIYATTTPATDRRPCLLQDPTYRLSLTDVSSGYYSQPMLGHTLTSETSSSLISGPQDGLSARGASPCAVTVMASAQTPLIGDLRLTTGPDATVEPASFPVSVAAGQVVKLPFAVRLTHPPSPLSGRVNVSVTATLKPQSGEALEARASLPVTDEPMTGVAVIGAGDFVEQIGGEGRLRTDKPNSAGRAFSHWNWKGHRVSW
ncbi:MAG: HEAT repeat domain-containing protein, partial [Armatimonadia bacterium]